MKRFQKALLVLVFYVLLCCGLEFMSRSHKVLIKKPLFGQTSVNTTTINTMSKYTNTVRLVEEKMNKNDSKITLMVRTSSKPKLLKYFYCHFLRTVVLFWPHSHGDVVVVLDGESASDKRFGKTLLRQVKRHFPEYSFHVFYEPLPRNPHILDNEFRGPAYGRQLWSTLLSDSYSKDNIIAYMDTDILMLTPITKHHLIKGNKLRVIGFYLAGHPFKRLVQLAIGYSMDVDYMVPGFPQMMYKSTYEICRQHIMKRLNTTDFEVAFRILRPKPSDPFPRSYFPVNILFTYAWYFERHLYDWHLKVPSLEIVNSGIPEGHKVQAEDTLVGIVPIYHNKPFLPGRIIPGYCMSMKAQGQMLPGCKHVTHNLARICDLDRGRPWHGHGTQCKGMGLRKCCQQAVNKHYEQVGQMARTGVHTVSKKKAEVVPILAKEMGIKCKPLLLP